MLIHFLRPNFTDISQLGDAHKGPHCIFKSAARGFRNRHMLKTVKEAIGVSDGLRGGIDFIPDLRWSVWKPVVCCAVA